MTRAFGRLAAFGFVAMSILVPAAALAEDGKTPDYQAIVAAPDRSDADRQTDQRRHPDKMLAFTGVKEGMKVLDMEANAGYSTELLARAVGTTGKVWAQAAASPTIPKNTSNSPTCPDASPSSCAWSNASASKNIPYVPPPLCEASEGRFCV